MIADNLKTVKQTIPEGTDLVAVSKFHSENEILEAYAAGQRIFAESRPQELMAKAGGTMLPKDIEWHFIGHLQTNKLKMVLPYVKLVQSVDTKHLLKEIDDWSRNNSIITSVLLELHIAAEETKQGFTEEEIMEVLFDSDKYRNVCFRGLMGMASHTDDTQTIEADFERIDSFMAYLVDTFPELEQFNQLSIGMSDDYTIALNHGATMVRIGTAIFGARQSSQPQP